MRLTLALLGLELDVTFGLAAVEVEDDPAAALNGGTLTSYPISFTPWPCPEEVPMPQHTPAWDEPEERGRT